MSANTNAKPAAATAAEEKVVPAQKSGETTTPTLADKINAIVTDAATAVKAEPGTALAVTVYLDEDDELQVEVVKAPKDGKAKQLAGKAKGVFQRNKKLVLATAGLAAASLVLKVIARRNAELEADEVVESSDDVAVDA
ncbi:hypothetical protein SEA_ANNIHILUS_35 [Streptomyces phage Annihilus]|nr:hypothetical protein SEA_ANNIHILUS_35 [Streptomyces phage Annihilus]